jgi:zinc protease
MLNVQIIISAIFLTLTTMISLAAPIQTHEFILSNGLKLLVREDHRAPVVVSQIWYKIGSSYESSRLTGISHLLEHLMFKGTQNVPNGEFSHIIAVNGGDENAFTSYDYTTYFQKLAKDRLEISFYLEADRMKNLVLNKDDVIREAKIVEEERRLRIEDQPEAFTEEQFNAAAYTTSPYRQPIIGWMQDITAITHSDLKQWYQQWYTPNNAVLIVVGDVDFMQVRELACKYFCAIPSGRIDTIFKPVLEIPQYGEHRIIVRIPAEVPYVIIGYKAPTLKTTNENWEPYALDILKSILDGGNSARLNRDLIRGSHLATKVSASYNPNSRLEGMFVLSGNPTSGCSITDLEHALRAEVKMLREELVDAEELARMVTQIIANEVYQQDSIFYQSMRMGIMEVAGLGWNKIEEYVKNIQAITPEQLRSVARRYLTEDRSTVAILEPLPLGS